MPIFRVSTAVLLSLGLLYQSMALPFEGENCGGMEGLGTPNLDRYDFSTTMDVDDTCEYTLKINFKHDASLPIPSDPMAQCDPSVVPPQMADDGMPYFAFRWAYGMVSEDIKKVTGIDHVSIDWNPCGHPPVEVFGAPHYDIHIYRESPEYRSCMTCNQPPGAPICDPTPGAQTTPNGLAFFDVSTEDEAIGIDVQRQIGEQPSNMPAGFRVGIADMVPLMGGHAWNPAQEPPNAMEWVNPIWIMGPYDRTIVNYESMIPYAFIVGDEDKSFSEPLIYEGQTIMELPTVHMVDYNGATGDITLTIKGSSADKSVCEKKTNVLPPISDLIERAYPTWCIDENENRLTDVETCADETPNGRFSPLYFTKQYSGADPALGGYPTNIDINYAFEFAAPYLGQACAGSPHMCPEDFDGSTTNCKKCPKLKTTTDNGPYGPGHVPPHISLAAVSRAYEEGKGGDIKDWFDYESNACRILPHKLLEMIRIYYPRDEEGKAYYPPPFSDLGGAYPLEFVNLAGESCMKEAEKHSTAGELDCFENHSGSVDMFPDYLEVGHGSPHYCTKAGKAADVNPDYCPYIFFGPNRGKYRHPHIAFSAVEVYLSNIVMPDKCETKWDDSNYPAKVDTTVAFPFMSDVISQGNLIDPQQPTIDDEGMWMWPGPEGYKKKPVVGNFATDLVIIMNYKKETTTSEPHSHIQDEHGISDDVEHQGGSEDVSMDDSAGFQGRTARVATIVSVLAMAFAI